MRVPWGLLTVTLATAVGVGGLVTSDPLSTERPLVPNVQGVQVVGEWQFEQTAKTNDANHYTLTVRAENHTIGPWKAWLMEIQPWLLDEHGDVLGVADCSWGLPVLMDKFETVTLNCTTDIPVDEGFRTVRYRVNAVESRSLTTEALEWDGGYE